MTKIFSISLMVFILGTLGLFPLNDAFAVDPPTFLLEWGNFGSGDNQFNFPQGVGVDSAGNVYVADNVNHRIQKFDSSGTFQGWLAKCTSGSNCDIPNQRSIGFSCTATTCSGTGTGGGGDGQLKSPTNVRFDSADNMYVADSAFSRIQKFDSSGTFLLKAGGFGSGGDGALNSVRDVAADSAGNMYVVDTGNDRIQKFDSSGIFQGYLGLCQGGPNCDIPNQRSIGFSCTAATCTRTCATGTCSGAGIGQFRDPRGIEVDSENNVYVVDSVNHRIQKFDSSGTFLTTWGGAGIGDGDLLTPHGIAIDSADNVYVAEFSNNRIQKFDSDGTFILKWGEAGPGDGQFNQLWGVTVDLIGNVYVADTGNSRIQKFGELITSSSQAIGQTTILGTCGLSFPDGNSVNYGAIIPNSISSEIGLNVTNSGSVSALLEIRGTDWKDGSNNSIMNVNQTHFNQTSFQNTFASKALLNSTDGIVTSSFVPSELVQLFLQLEAVLLDPFFTGSASQTMDFTVSC